MSSGLSSPALLRLFRAARDAPTFDRAANLSEPAIRLHRESLGCCFWGEIRREIVRMILDKKKSLRLWNVLKIFAMQ